jgi:tetratricopeptide (TPR) repeat protein
VAVVCGIPPEVLDALVNSRTKVLEELVSAHRETITLLKGSLDLNERQIRAALEAIGESNVPAERLAAKFVEIAENFKALREAASAQPGDTPNIAALKADAQKAIEAGELARADALLADVETDQRRAHDRFAMNEAETSARRGDIALTRLRYAEAAKHFANAAAVFPPQSAHENKRISYLQKEASALYQQGYELGDNSALFSAIELRKRLLELTPRERAPLQWARTQNSLGLALLHLGERESGTAKLEQAVAAFREALKERTRERAPLDWASTQNNLGYTFMRLGERDSGTAKLEEAVTAYREALKERTRERVPLAWAGTQNNLGIVLVDLAGRETGRERGTAKLEEAVAAYREALKERTREHVRLEWATTQSNLCTALERLGERESEMAKLDEAVVACREALKERTRERVPLDWARTQSNLCIALERLGDRESGTVKLEEAITACREALKERTRERVPLDWARSFGDEGIALMLLAERRRDAAMAKTALSQINEAFETMRDGGNAPGAAHYKRQLPRARDLVAQLRGRETP